MASLGRRFRRAARKFWWISLLLAIACAPKHAPTLTPKPQFSVTILPRVGIGPLDVMLTFAVPELWDARGWCLEIDGPLGRRSCESLPPPHRWQQRYDAIPGGQYHITFSIILLDGTVKSTSADACYTGLFENLCD